jgi:hypothetical protein
LLEHVSPQSMPGMLEVIVPDPVPVRLTVSVYSVAPAPPVPPVCGLNSQHPESPIIIPTAIIALNTFIVAPLGC